MFQSHLFLFGCFHNCYLIGLRCFHCTGVARPVTTWQTWKVKKDASCQVTGDGAVWGRREGCMRAASGRRGGVVEADGEGGVEAAWRRLCG